MTYKEGIKYLFILIGSIYLVTVFEREFGNKSHESDIKRAYEQGKQEMRSKNEDLEHQIRKYEADQLKEELVIDGMSNDELDSTWATIFPR